MKKQIFFACTTFLLAGILACTQQPVKDPAATAPKLMFATDQKTGELDAKAATEAITGWEKYRDSLQVWLHKSLPTVANEIPMGFKIPSQDIHSLDSIARGTQELYAMLALQPDSTGKIGLTLIFRAPDKTGTLKYYDFSEPCPPCIIPIK